MSNIKKFRKIRKKLKGLHSFVFLVFLTANACAGWQEGLDALHSGDYEAAFEEFEVLAEQGDAAAQNNLGILYSQGDGVPQNYKEAFRWFSLAAEQGILAAQYRLGLMHSKGEGVPQDYKKRLGGTCLLLNRDMLEHNSM
ncbi:MAG: hypothetical protein CMK56_05645 [Proteobacteria bacterium]|nr:hypothetical protein [Pseudomonadota bacterium]